MLALQGKDGRRMADVKWIKIATDIFDDEKILLIESLPEADSIIVIWYKLLCLAGKMNNNGVFTMNNKIAYTDKMLSTIFRRKEATVQLALQTFEQFGMIQVIDGVITIPNWEKHQNIEGMEKIREQTRKRVANHREKQKQLSCNVTSAVTVTDCNATDKIREEEKRKEEEKSKRETTHSLFQRLLPEYNFSDVLASKVSDWIQYKVERKEPYKEQGMKSLLRQIENKAMEHGDSAICNLIDECMASNWKGIIFERLNNQKPKEQKGRLDWIDGI